LFEKIPFQNNPRQMTFEQRVVFAQKLFNDAMLPIWQDALLMYKSVKIDKELRPMNKQLYGSNFT